MKNIAILLTVFNRKEKTRKCLYSIKSLQGLSAYCYDIFIVDGGSTDGTPDAITSEFHDVHLSVHNGLFWAGGMRQAWKEAMEYRNDYDYFFLLNDDTCLFPTCLKNLLQAEDYAIKNYGRLGIYVGSTCDPGTGKLTYGALGFDGNWITPDGKHVRDIKLGNANIMLVSRHAYDIIGGFADYCTHGIADYDYSLRAIEKNIPLLSASQFCGECENDHKKTWLPQSASLKERIMYLYSPKGLAYKEYMVYVKRFFPRQVVKIHFLLWFKTLFPIIWEKYKKIDQQ